jgi:hypothetical protein
MLDKSFHTRSTLLLMRFIWMINGLYYPEVTAIAFGFWFLILYCRYYEGKNLQGVKPPCYENILQQGASAPCHTALGI